MPVFRTNTPKLFTPLPQEWKWEKITLREYWRMSQAEWDHEVDLGIRTHSKPWHWYMKYIVPIRLWWIRFKQRVRKWSRGNGQEQETTVVYALAGDEHGNMVVYVTDYPNAAATIGAVDMRLFRGSINEWPKEAIEYAEELAKQHFNAPIEYEPWLLVGDEIESADED